MDLERKPFQSTYDILNFKNKDHSLAICIGNKF